MFVLHCFLYSEIDINRNGSLEITYLNYKYNGNHILAARSLKHTHPTLTATIFLLYDPFIYFFLDVHVTVHRNKFLTIKPTRCTDFSNLFLE